MSGLQTVLLVVGALAALAGVAALILRVRTLVAGARAQGVVVENVRGSTIGEGRNARTMLEPVVEFPHEGRKVRFRSSMGTKDGLPVGQRVEVRYLPGDPQNTAEIGTSVRMFGFPVAALAFGVLLLGFVALDTGWLGGR